MWYRLWKVCYSTRLKHWGHRILTVCYQGRAIFFYDFLGRWQKRVCDLLGDLYEKFSLSTFCDFIDHV